ncbi:hypothetical protein R1flu_009445 [Riccia fluitans]|uniref:Uncharacterized protein n=1 Tax=Riccia fluitans TaxID=41844 RepID=A0ABD1Z297_9MARC
MTGFVAFGSSAAGSSYPSFPVALLEGDDASINGEGGYFTPAQNAVRHLLQTTGNGNMIHMNGTFLLAANRTNRRDPLDNFHIYRGGWNIQDKHYWGSVGYTGLSAFIVALIWAALGLLGLLFLLCCCCFCGSRKQPEYDHGRCGYVIPIILLLFFTAAAVAGSDKAEIVTLNRQLNDSANTLRDETRKNADDIKHIINIVRIALMVVAAVMLLLVLLGLLFAACGIRSIVYLASSPYLPGSEFVKKIIPFLKCICGQVKVKLSRCFPSMSEVLLLTPVSHRLVFLGWILVTGTWILCGIFILLNNAIGDTCVAMEEWVARPFANTTLDEILPCADPATANSALVNSKDYTDQIITLANQGITRIAIGNFPPGTPTYYNQSGPLVPTLCDIYGPAPDYNLQSCSAPNLTLEAAPALSTAADIGQSLFVDGNFLVSVANCSFVRDTFTVIRGTYCDNLRKYAKWVWIGLILLVSGGAMLSILLWMVYIRRKRYRYAPGENGKAPPVYNGSAPNS